VASLEESLAWLDQHINLEARAGRVEHLSLDRMRRLVDVLGDPQRAYPVIHLTGTNGKGSTARLITSLLVEAGLSVGTYTSPHLQRINERIARSGDPISDDELAEVLSDLEQFEGLVGEKCSYFELLTAAALRWFADVAVDVAVVEVGLLGRYDATNVCDGTVAVVTNVGQDHTDLVGDWRAKIASEKAGVIKPGSTLVLGETDELLAPIFYRAGAAEVWERDREFACEANELAVGGRLLALRTPWHTLDDVFLSLHGAHQGDNAACALAAAEAFFAQPLDDDVVVQAFGSVTMPGRFEIVGREPLVVLDGAHNPEGAAVAAATLRDDFMQQGRRIIVIGMLQPRDPVALLDALEVDDSTLVVACEPDWPRALAPSAIAAAASALGADVIEEPDVGRAVDRARRLAAPEDAVLITGSLYVVGAARTHLGL
jgi:dihydrofolate synthase / folylpolyglutamate synthase